MKREDNRYLDILKKYDKRLWDAAIQQEADRQGYDSVERVIAQVGGVSIYLYILWIIEEARKRNIRRLYFLARDGQIFFEVAKVICEGNDIDIECRYLYCSRLAWRVPRYFLMNENCLDYICQRSMNLSIDKMFERTLLGEEQRKEICEELSISQENRKKILDYDEINIIKEKFKGSKKFLKLVYEKSKIEYQNTIHYLQQEGLTEKKRFAIVDTGWVGSMQEGLSELLSYYKKEQVIIEGFYFGMFRLPPNSPQKYHTYLFSSRKDLWKKVRFNNNLLECMCGATDGMTLCYKNVSGIWEPCFASQYNLNSDKWDIQKNHILISQYAEYICKKNGVLDITYESSRKITGKLMETFMIYPTKEEAENYGKYLFSDDMTEKGVMELAPCLKQVELFGEDFIPKVLKRLFVKDTIKRQTKSYWMEGSIKRSRTKLQVWHRFNSMLWHLLQFGSV